MKLADAFPSKYLKAVDIPEPTVTTIKLAEEENIKGLDGKEQCKVVLYFQKAEAAAVEPEFRVRYGHLRFG
jgi:hypothetical protein